LKNQLLVIVSTSPMFPLVAHLDSLGLRESTVTPKFSKKIGLNFDPSLQKELILGNSSLDRTDGRATNYLYVLPLKDGPMVQLKMKPSVFNGPKPFIIGPAALRYIYDDSQVPDLPAMHQPLFERRSAKQKKIDMQATERAKSTNRREDEAVLRGKKEERNQKRAQMAWGNGTAQEYQSASRRTEVGSQRSKILPGSSPQS
jgi:hypothetical protein